MTQKSYRCNAGIAEVHGFKISFKNELDKIDSNTIFVQMGKRNNLNAEIITARLGKTPLAL